MADLHIHELSVRGHRVTCADATIIQHSMGHDAITIELDEEWDGLSVVLAMTGQDGRTYEIIYTGEPIVIPASLTEEPGLLSVCVVGYGGDGKVRVLTAKASRLLRVEPSGPYEGDEPVPDSPDMLQQLTDAYERANEAAESAEDAAKAVESASIDMGTVTTIGSGEQASASLDGEGLQKTLNLSIPKGDPGEKGDTGATGATGAAATIAVGSVSTLPAGSEATVENSGTASAAIFDFGIPKGDKGDKGDPGYTPQRGVDYWTAEDVEAVVEDAKTQAVAELAEIGNVPKRTVTDLVAHGEDAYAQKPIEVRVKGKTWVNRWPVLNANNYGVTVSTGEDGMITLSGTASAAFISSANVQGVSPNKQITIVPSKQIGTGVSTAGLWIRFFDSDGADIGGVNAVGFQNEKPVTLTTPNNMASMTASVVVYEGITVSGTFRVMLVDGTEAPDCFTPPASITSVQTGRLVTSGKNVLDISGAVKKGRNVVLPNARLVAGATYTYTSPSTATNAVALHDVDTDIRLVTYIQPGRTQTFTVPASCTFKGGISLAGVSDSAIVLGDEQTAMVELGSTATAYEPPNVTTTPLPEVELRSLPNGTADELVIKADGTCEVERRTQLAGGEVVALDEPTTEPQSPVTLPVLPAPTFNQYHDSDVPSDTSTEYARDINIVLANLESVQAALLGGE